MFRECFFLVTLPLKAAKFIITLAYQVIVASKNGASNPLRREAQMGKLRLDHLNDLELLHVMSYLSPTDVFNFSLVCKRFAHLFQARMKSIQSIRSVNKNVTSSKICTSMFKEYKDLFRSNIDVALNYGKFLNVLILHMPRVKNVWLDGCLGINDRNLYLLGDYMPCLTSLWLFNANVSDVGLQRFFRFAPNLEKLALKSIECRGSCFNSIGDRVKSLIFLICWGPEMNGYRMLANKLSDKLEELTVVNKGINGDEVAQFVSENFVKLKRLCLRVRLSMASMLHIRKLKNLEHLQMIFNTVHHNDLIALPAMHNVKTCHFEFNSISDEDLSHVLSKFRNIEQLSLYFDARTDRCITSLETIANFNYLKRLSITTFKLFENASDFRSLVNCRQLNNLELGYLSSDDVYPLFDCFRAKALEENRRYMLKFGTRFVETFHCISSDAVKVKFYSFWDRPSNNNPMLYFIDLLFLASLH